MALARALTQDMIASAAQQSTLKKVLDEYDKEIAILRENGKFNGIPKTVTALALKTLTIDYGSEATGTADDAGVVELSTTFSSGRAKSSTVTCTGNNGDVMQAATTRLSRRLTTTPLWRGWKPSPKEERKPELVT